MYVPEYTCKTFCFKHIHFYSDVEGSFDQYLKGITKAAPLDTWVLVYDQRDKGLAQTFVKVRIIIRYT